MRSADVTRVEADLRRVIARNIKATARAQGVDLYDLQQRLGMQASQFCRVLYRGSQSDGMTIKTLERVALALGVPIERLIMGGK